MVAGLVEVHRAGLVPYPLALEWMRCCRLARRDGASGDCLLLMQHPPVITLGMSGGQEDVLITPESLAQQGIVCVETERGGRATLHAPGQLVAYPVMWLGDGDLHDYLWKLEEALLQTLAGWHIPAERNDAHPGLWVRGRKIAALGLAVRQGVAFHGAALNVNTDLMLYRFINPCGLSASQVTSMQSELGEMVAFEQVEEAFIEAFCEIFDRQAIVRTDLFPWKPPR
jgi:lipoate-protein ligase B